MKQYSQMRLLEPFRIRQGIVGTDASYERNGFFTFKHGLHELRVLVSDGRDWKECGLPEPVWEHVSVSLVDRCPTWEEMQYVKKLFWDDEETVLQIHPPQSRYVNHHPFTLHLWKPIGVELPLPPTKTIAP